MSVSKQDQFRSRMGNNVAESMGSGRQSGVVPGWKTHEIATQPDPLEGTTRRSSARTIQLARIMANPDADQGQPRTEFDQRKLEDLAASLREHGQLQSITVRWSPTHEKYLIVAGERRFRASALAGFTTINADVIEDDDPVSVRIKQLVENCQREDLTPMEQARAFHAAMNAQGSQYPTAASLAAKLKTSESAISRALRLLDLPEAVQEMVEAKKLTPTTAYEVSKAPVEDQPALAERIVSERLTVLEAAKVVDEMRTAEKRKPAGQGCASKAKAKGRPKLITSRTFKGEGGYRITVERTKGVELAGLAAALREVFEAIESESSQGGG